MIRIQTYVNDEVLAQIKAGYDVIPSNVGSGFDRTGNLEDFGYKSMYDVLKTASTFNKFFFAIEVDTTEQEHADSICQMSSNGNIHKLIIEMPKSECHRMNYYTYSDLLYFIENSDTDESEYIKYCINAIKNQEIGPTDVVQVIYPKIKVSQIIEIIEA